MKKINLLFTLFIALLVMFSSCKPDDKNDTPNPTNNTPTGNVTVKVNHTFGAAAFDFTSTFKNPSDNTEDMTFSSIQYILSNFELQTTDGTWVPVPESYYYINGKQSQSLSFTLKDVKIQDYKAVRFLIGVDSTRNVSGAQTGGLDPATGMFWSWNTGYIFFKVEGDCPQLTTPFGSSNFVYHIGGFNGQYNALVWAEASFGSKTLSVKSGSNTLLLKADVEEVFKKPIAFELTNTPQITLNGPEAVAFALNYADMFSVTDIE